MTPQQWEAFGHALDGPIDALLERLTLLGAYAADCSVDLDKGEIVFAFIPPEDPS